MVTKDPLSSETIFVWPLEWSFKTGSPKSPIKIKILLGNDRISCRGNIHARKMSKHRLWQQAIEFFATKRLSGLDEIDYMCVEDRGRRSWD